MKTSKFFRFTIQGDDLNLDEIKNINLVGKVFRKGETFSKPYVSRVVVQKTNRWVYRDDLIDNSSVSSFLTKNLEILVRNLNQLRYFIDKYKTKIELTIYADNKTDICLTQKQIDLLKKIGTKFYISFC